MPPVRQKLLSSSRPQPLTQTKAPKLSSKTTQSIISKHHTLQKQLAQARKSGADEHRINAIEAEIEANGGLKLYQQASTQGQSKERGGDTSKVLVDWLDLTRGAMPGEGPLRILEVGALSTNNALNIEGVTQVRRIDLHSQEPGIEERDFMDLDPYETWEEQTGYGVLSLSLVVNYVSEPKARGEMLLHSVQFLRYDDKRSGATSIHLPALFLVLPLSCVDNSRYFTEELLDAMMGSLGYEKIKVKRSSKLFYSLWRLLPSNEQSVTNLTSSNPKFKKTELRSGKDRNNFSIVLDRS